MGPLSQCVLTQCAHSEALFLSLLGRPPREQALPLYSHSLRSVGGGGGGSDGDCGGGCRPHDSHPSRPGSQSPFRASAASSVAANVDRSDEVPPGAATGGVSAAVDTPGAGAGGGDARPGPVGLTLDVPALSGGVGSLPAIGGSVTGGSGSGLTAGPGTPHWQSESASSTDGTRARSQSRQGVVSPGGQLDADSSPAGSAAETPPMPPPTGATNANSVLGGVAMVSSSTNTNTLNSTNSSSGRQSTSALGGGGSKDAASSYWPSSDDADKEKEPHDPDSLLVGGGRGQVSPSTIPGLSHCRSLRRAH